MLRLLKNGCEDFESRNIINSGRHVCTAYRVNSHAIRRPVSTASVPGLKSRGHSGVRKFFFLDAVFELSG